MARKTTGTDPLETLVDKRLPDPFSRAVARVADRLQHDTDHFVLPSQDLNGHSDPIQTRVQPGWVRSMSAIITSRAFPFRTQGDFVRWCIWIGMHTLNELDPSTSIEKSADVIAGIVRSRDRIIEMEMLFERSAERAVELRRRGFNREVTLMLIELRDAIQTMPSGEVREMYKKRFDGMFRSWQVDVDARTPKQLDLFAVVKDDSYDYSE